MWRNGSWRLALVVLPAALGAQQRNTLFGSQFVNAGAGQTTTVCGSTAPAQAVLSMSCTSADGRVAWSGLAAADHGALHATARVAASGEMTQSGTTWYTSAQAEWFDVARLSGSGSSSATFLDLILSVNGTERGSVVDGGQSAAFCSAFAQDYYTFQALSGDIDTGFNFATAYATPECVPAPGTSDGVSGSPVDVSVSRQIVVPVPITSGVGIFNYLIRAYASLGDLYPSTLTGSADADFGHTVTLDRFVVRDAQGADITGSVGVTFDHGTLVTQAIVATPEPGSLALTASGLFGVGAVGLRRRVRPRRA